MKTFLVSASLFLLAIGSVGAIPTSQVYSQYGSNDGLTSAAALQSVRTTAYLSQFSSGWEASLLVDEVNRTGMTVGDDSWYNDYGSFDRGYGSGISCSTPYSGSGLEVWDNTAGINNVTADPVPEPITFVLFGAGLAVIGLRRKFISVK